MKFIPSEYKATCVFKVKYKEAYLAILNIINELDPVGILVVNIEEYDLEVLEIMANLKSCSSVEETRILIIDVFDSYFGMPSCKQLISNEVATNVFDCLKLMNANN